MPFGSGEKPVPKTGYVVGDEPYAVQAGASVLSEGGSAVDAATTIYFALATTYPVAAGIGGGGICVVHDQESNRTDTFSFLARNATGGGTYGVPGAVRGFALMQAVYGRLPWQRDVAPGEGFAATGFPMSRALAARIEASQDVIRLDANLSAEFLSEAGTAKSAGSIVSNSALAATLSAIRHDGPDAFYRGAIAQKIEAYSSAQNGAIKDTDLAAYTPTREAATSINIGDITAFVPPDDLGAGKFIQSLLSQINGNIGNADSSGNLTQLVASATTSSLGQFKVESLPKDLGATGFAATDVSGQSVACAVTMNGPFGSGHTAEGTGVTLPNSPSSPAGVAGAFLTPVIAANSDGALMFVGAGAGGPNGSAAAAYALARLGAGADVTKPGEIHTTGIAPYDTINAIACTDSVCSTLPDPGAYGLGMAGRL